MLTERKSWLFIYASNIGSAAVNVFTSTIIVFTAARFLSLEELGTYFLALLITHIASTLVDFGFRSSVIQDTAYLDGADKQRFASEYLGQGIAQAFLTITGILILVLISLQSFAPSVHDAFLLSIPCTVINILFQNGVVIRVAEGRASSSAKLLTYAEIQKLLLSIIAIFTEYKLEILCLAWPMSRLIGVSFMYYGALSEISLSFILKGFSQLLGTLRRNLYVYATSLLSLIQMKVVDVALLSYGDQLVQLAIFNLAFQIPAVVLRVLDPIRPILQRQIRSGEADEMVFKVAFYALLCISLLTAAGAILLSPEIDKILYAGKLNGSNQVSWLLALWLVPSGINLLMATAMIARGQGKLVLFSAIAQIIVMLISSYLFVPHLGALGAAAAMLTTAILAVAFSGLAVQIYVKMPVIVPMLLGVAASAILVALSVTMSVYFPALPLRIGALCLLALVITIAFRGLCLRNLIVKGAP